MGTEKWYVPVCVLVHGAGIELYRSIVWYAVHLNESRALMTS